MRLCVVTMKQCWRGAGGRWESYGGFPAQMAALRGLCDELTLLMVAAPSRAGGIPLPPDAEVLTVRSPSGVDTVRKLSVLSQLPYYMRAIWRALETADLVHVPIPGDISFLGMLAAVARRRPLFMLYNGSWAPNSQTTVMNRVTRQCMRLLARGPGLMLAVGDGDQPPAPGMEWLFATSLTRAEVAGIRPRTAEGWSDPPRLIYAGRLSVEKGMPVLLDALGRLRAAGVGPMPHLTIAGDGPDRPLVEQAIHRLGIGPWVTLAGQLDRPRLFAELGKADLCVHPALSEGYCKAWLDAMAHGLPVLGTDVGAARSVMGSRGERGWLVPAGDSAAFVEALAGLLHSPPDWEAVRRRCRAFAEGRTLEAWAARIGALCAARWPGVVERRPLTEGA